MKPKWMLTHPSGALMIEKVVGGIDTDAYADVYIVVLQEHCDKHEADVVLKQAFPSTKFKVVVLQSPTASSPETVYRCIQSAKLNGWIVVKDCDCLVSYDIPKDIKRFVVGTTVKNQTVRNLAQKSFIVDDENRVIKEVIEKRVVSDRICVGVYAMHTEDLVRSYNKLSVFMSDELYFSHIVSDMIDGESRSFLSVDAKQYEDWGTKEDWFSASNLKNTYFLDIDGVLLKNTGKYGSKNWYNTIEPIDENVSVIKKLSDDGHEIIFVTSRDADALPSVEKFLKTKGIKYKTIVPECFHSKRIIVNDFANTNPFPSCIAINIPRNGSIDPYIQ
jgi:hypothetical protein